MPVVWLQAVIIICAYTGYKATDDFSLLSRDALGFDDVQASGIGTLAFWIRAAAAITAGFPGDRIDASRVIVWGCVILIGGCLLIASGVLVPGPAWMLIATIVTASVGIYALRGVYFALLAEGHVPLAYTGSAAGLVSVLGFTPDVFMGPLMGVLLDTSGPGAGDRLGRDKIERSESGEKCVVENVRGSGGEVGPGIECLLDGLQDRSLRRITQIQEDTKARLVVGEESSFREVAGADHDVRRGRRFEQVYLGVEGEWQAIVENDYPTSGRHRIQQVLQSLEGGTLMIDTSDDLHVAGSGELGESRCHMPYTGALYKGDGGPEVCPLSAKIVLQIVAETTGRGGLMDKLHDGLSDRDGVSALRSRLAPSLDSRSLRHAR